MRNPNEIVADALNAINVCPDLPTLEQRMEDVHAVLNAVGSKRAALMGISEGGPMCALFAATYPEPTSALIMCGSYARWIRDDDCTWAMTREQHEAAAAAFERNWGTPIGFKTVAPTSSTDERPPVRRPHCERGRWDTFDLLRILESLPLERDRLIVG